VCIHVCIYIVYIYAYVYRVYLYVYVGECVYSPDCTPHHIFNRCALGPAVYMCVFIHICIYICIHIYIFECAYSMCVSVLYLCMYVGECAHSPKFECRHFFNCCVLRPVVYTHVFIHSVYAHVCIHLCVSID